MTSVPPSSLELHGIDLETAHGQVLRGIELRVMPGELFVVLGNQGAGKTSLLRVIAGLDRPSRGDVWIDERRVTAEPAQHRGTVLMQPDYPLWPRFSVLRNITFALRHRGVDRKTGRQRAIELLDVMGLGEFAGHLPHQLTASQRQRVALARTLASEARVSLLDDPLSTHGLQLRDRLLLYLKRRHEQRAETLLLATEDPQQAIRLADRMMVMENGEIAQIGSPVELYDSPASRHVAELLGRANLIEGEIEYAAEQPLFRGLNGVVIPLFDRKVKRARKGWAMFRPHDLTLITLDDAPFGDEIRLGGRVDQIEFHGATLRYLIDLGGASVWAELQRSARQQTPQIGDTVVLGIDPVRIQILER
jgi:iron(III) transport system ATP-binding protein